MNWTELLSVAKEWGPLVGGLGAFALPFLYKIMKDARTRRIEAQKPHLTRQLKLYTEACRVTVCLATSDDQTAKGLAERRFWELYWGELCMVEDRRVEHAMKKFGDALREKRDQDYLKHRSYELAHALRDSLEAAWGFRLRKVLPY